MVATAEAAAVRRRAAVAEEVAELFSWRELRSPLQAPY
jgi:hypothetical protein